MRWPVIVHQRTLERILRGGFETETGGKNDSQTVALDEGDFFFASLMFE